MVNILVVAAFIFLLLDGVLAIPPSEIHIAFYFPMFPLYEVADADFKPSKTGIQMVAAVLMAIREINSKEYVKFSSDSLLPNTQLKVTVRTNPPTYTGAVNTSIGLIVNSFNGAGVDVAIGAIATNLTQAMASIFQDSDIAQIGYNQGSLMSHTTLYSHYLRIGPTISYEGKVLADVIYKSFKWRHVTVFSTRDDTDCVDLLTEFEDEVAVNGLQIVGSYLSEAKALDFSHTLAMAKPTEPRIIVLFMKPQNTAAFLEQAYAKGLLTSGVTVIGTTLTTTSAMYPLFSNTTDIPAVLKGYIGIASNMNWTSSTQGKAFLRRWRKQPNTISYDSNGTLICNAQMDDDSSFYYYQQHVNYNTSKPFVCAGLNFSTFDASNIYLYAGFAYDAIYAAAYGIHELLYNQGQTKISGALLKKVLVEYPPYEGLTGMISFSSGRSSSKSYGIGDRISGYSFNVYSFNTSNYAGITGSTGFDLVGTCADDGIVTFTLPVSYNTRDGSKPSDTPPDINIGLPADTKSAFLDLAIILIIVTVLCMAYCYVFIHSSAVRAAQPYLLQLTFLGCLLVSARLIVITYPVSPAQCVARQYTFHLSFAILLGSIVAKLWRMHLLCNVATTQKVDVSEGHAIRIFCVGLASVFFYLVLLTSIDVPTVVVSVTVANTGQRSLNLSCASSILAMEYALLAFEVILLFGSVGLSLATMSAPERVNETSLNAKIILCVVIYLVVYIVQSFIPGIDPVIIRTAFGAVCILVVVVTLFFTMLPKVAHLLEKAAPIAQGTSTKPYLDDIAPGSSDRDLLEHGTKQDKLTICFNHLILWTGMLHAAQNSEFKSSQDQAAIEKVKSSEHHSLNR